MVTAEKLVTQHLDLWATAIKRKSTAGRGSSSKVELYGIKKLRELILELAVRGMLVPQDPMDEPASELLKRIAAERAKLVKEGKIKKEKPLAPVSDDEKYFDVPTTWEWCRLQEVSEYIQRGKGPAYADFGTVRVVSQKCVQWSGFDISASRFVDDASLSGYKDERFLKSNDLLWNSTGTGTVGRANVLSDISEKTLVADSHVTVIRPLIATPRYLCSYIWSPSVQTRIEPEHEKSLVSGSTQQVELNTSAVMALPVPIPPLNEQKSIVAKVDELMALCDQLEQQTDTSLSAHQTLVATLLNALTSATDHAQFTSSWQRIAEHFDTLFTTEDSIDQLKQTILQLAVMGKLVPQDPNDEPASELLKKIAADKAKLVKDGKVKKEVLFPKISEEELPFKPPINWGVARLGELIKISSGDGLTSAQMCPSGEIPVYGGNGVTGYHDQVNVNKPTLVIGRVGFYCGSVHVTPGNAWVTDNAFITSFSEEVFTIRYLALLLKGTNLKENENATAQPVISGRKVYPIPVCFPPVEEQSRILVKFEELMAVCDQLKSRIGDAQTTQLHLADAVAEQALSEA